MYASQVYYLLVTPPFRHICHLSRNSFSPSPYTYISLCPSPCWPCLCVASRDVCMLYVACVAALDEHVCVCVSPTSEEAQYILHKTSLHLVLQATKYAFNWRPTVLCCRAHRGGVHLPFSILRGTLCAPSVRLLCPSAASATGTRTRVARVRAEYPGQLDYSGFC